MQEKWKEHAYPLKQLTITVQTTRHGNVADLVSYLELALKRIKAGDLQAMEHDDDAGYLIGYNDEAESTIFPDEGCGGY